MCGIAGFVDSSRSTSSDQLAAIAEAMAATLSHRGPDDDGVWVDASVGVALGHRRLSILDLSAAGHQPMVSADGRWVLTYNGETYNYAQIRSRLVAEGIRFRGASDSEVILEGFARWGVVPTLRQMNGMFALAVWDRREQRLWLARDRMGEKPLYFGWLGETFLFGSELKALKANPRFKADVDRGAAALFLRLNYVPAPHTIYGGISKLRAGEVIEVDIGRRSCRERTYWSAVNAAQAGAADPTEDADLAVERLEPLLSEAVALRMVADVPVGAFLSGGIDSSLMVALAAESQQGPVRTFTIGFEDASFDEAGYARSVASHLGTEHTELYVSPEAALDTVPLLPAMYDEPFADSSQLPTHLVAKLARRDVTVSISGDGADEVFGGYSRYQVFLRTWGVLRRSPRWARRAGAAAILRMPQSWWTARLQRLPPRLRQARAGERLHKLALMAQASSDQAAYRVALSQWQDPAWAIAGGAEPTNPLTDPAAWLEDLPLAARPRLVDQLLYLPEDILVKVDRATMAVSLEARAPFLDHRVVELSWTLPPAVLYRDGRGKWPLRAMLARRLPVALFERPKQGFAVPVSAWLRGPLREWAEDLLAPSRLRTEGLLDEATVRELWSRHLARDDEWSGGYDLWAVLMLQAWLAAA